MKKLMMVAILIAMVFSVNAQNWSKKNYVDEFGDKTTETYISSIQRGVFSNSAATNRKLLVAVEITDSSLTFDLWEYGSHKASMSSEFGKLLVKDDKGSVFKIKCFQNKGYLFFQKSNYTKLINVLKNSKYIKCSYTEVSKYSKSKYKFTVNTENLFELIK